MGRSQLLNFKKKRKTKKEQKTRNSKVVNNTWIDVNKVDTKRADT